MNIQRKNSAHHFRMQSEREQTLIVASANFFFFLIFFLKQSKATVEINKMGVEYKNKGDRLTLNR